MTEPTEKCPYCGTECTADWCDVGVGMVQCGPFYCQNCGASEIGEYDKPRELTEDEKRTRWYAPHSEPGSSANVIHGKVVTAEHMQSVYRDANQKHPESFETEESAQAWFQNLRRKKTVDELKDEVKRRFKVVHPTRSQ